VLKETYIFVNKSRVSNELYTLSKETNIASKETYIVLKVTYIVLKVTYIVFKETCIAFKEIISLKRDYPTSSILCEERPILC